MSANRPRLQDIADLVGVAKSTVSMALARHPRIPEDTAKRIEAVARKLGYRPDPVLSAMARNRWRSSDAETGGRVLAYVHSLPRSRALRTVARFSGAGREARRLGYQLEGFRLGDLGDSMMRLASVLRARSIRGVLFDSLLKPDAFIGFPWEEFASAWCGTHTESVLTHTIELDAFRRFEEAWRRARETGATRIGFLTTRTTLDERWTVSEAAYRTCVARERVGGLAMLNLRTEPETTGELSAVKDWLRSTRPEVVITSDNTGLDLLKRAGARVPDDIGLLSLHIWPRSSTVSGFSAMLEEQGEAAVRLVHHDLLNHHFGLPVNPLVVTIKARWQEGETLPTAGRFSPSRTSRPSSFPDSSGASRRRAALPRGGTGA